MYKVHYTRAGAEIPGTGGGYTPPSREQIDVVAEFRDYAPAYDFAAQNYGHVETPEGHIIDVADLERRRRR